MKYKISAIIFLKNTSNLCLIKRTSNMIGGKYTQRAMNNSSVRDYNVIGTLELGSNPV